MKPSSNYPPTNPYVAYINMTLVDNNKKSHKLISRDCFLSMEIERFYNKGSKLSLMLIDKSGGYELEKLLLTYTEIIIEYGYTGYIKGNPMKFTLLQFSPNLESGYSVIEIVGISTGVAEVKDSPTKEVRGGKDITIDQIVKEIAAEEGWAVGHIEPTVPIMDDRENVEPENKLFVQGNVNSLVFIQEELCPLAVSKETGRSGYTVYLRDVVAVKDGEPDKQIYFVSSYWKFKTENKLATKGKSSKSKFQYDLRTPKSAAFDHALSFIPKINNQISGSGAIVSADTGTGTVASTDDKGASDKIEQKTNKKLGNTVLASSTSSTDEAIAKSKSMKDYTFPTTFTADASIIGNPNIEVLDIVEFDLVMNNQTLHHSSGEYIVMGVTDTIAGGSFITNLKLGRGTNIEAYVTKDVAPVYSDTGTGGALDSYSTSGGVRVPQAVDGVSAQILTDAMNVLLGQGMSLKGASWMCGNVIQESHFNVNCVGDLNAKDGYGPAYGITQMRAERRFRTFNGIKYSIPTNPNTIKGQLIYSCMEMQMKEFNKKVWQVLTSPNASDEAMDLAIKNYERFGIAGRRGEFSRRIWAMVRNQTGTPVTVSQGTTNTISNGAGNTQPIPSGFNKSGRTVASVRTRTIKSAGGGMVTINFPFMPVLPMKNNPGVYSLSDFNDARYKLYGDKSKYYHEGVDLKINHPRNGSPTICLAMGPGKVTMLRPNFTDNKYSGKLIKLDHGSGIESLYMHLDSISSNIQMGTIVAGGQVMGVCGGSRAGVWNGTIWHLHFGIKYNKVYVDPTPLLVSWNGGKGL